MKAIIFYQKINKEIKYLRRNLKFIWISFNNKYLGTTGLIDETLNVIIIIVMWSGRVIIESHVKSLLQDVPHWKNTMAFSLLTTQWPSIFKIPAEGFIMEFFRLLRFICLLSKHQWIVFILLQVKFPKIKKPSPNFSGYRTLNSY